MTRSADRQVFLVTQVLLKTTIDKRLSLFKLRKRRMLCLNETVRYLHEKSKLNKIFRRCSKTKWMLVLRGMNANVRRHFLIEKWAVKKCCHSLKLSCNYSNNVFKNSYALIKFTWLRFMKKIKNWTNKSKKKSKFQLMLTETNSINNFRKIYKLMMIWC